MQTPICIFAYNRPKHLKQVIDGIEQNFPCKEISKIYFFLDAPKNIKDENLSKKIEYIIKQIKFVDIKIIRHKTNLRFKNNFLFGIDYLFRKYNKVIVLGDDTVPQKGFLNFMLSAFKKYEKNNKVMNYSGYNYPIEIPESYNFDSYFSTRAGILPIGLTREFWKNFSKLKLDHNEVLNSKIIRKKLKSSGEDLHYMFLKDSFGWTESIGIWVSFYVNLHDGLCLKPTKNLINIIGYDNTGMHCKITDKFKNNNYFNKHENFNHPNEIKINSDVNETLMKFFKVNFILKLIFDFTPNFILKKMNFLK